METVTVSLCIHDGMWSKLVSANVSTNYSDTYFNASSKLIFLEGDHNFSENFTIQVGKNFTKLTLINEGKLQQSRIHFGELVTFTVYGLHNLTIELLEFLKNSNFNMRCSKTVCVMNVYFSGPGYSMTFEAIDQLTALNLTVSNSSSS